MAPAQFRRLESPFLMEPWGYPLVFLFGYGGPAQPLRRTALQLPLQRHRFLILPRPKKKSTLTVAEENLYIVPKVTRSVLRGRERNDFEFPLRIAMAPWYRIFLRHPFPNLPSPGRGISLFPEVCTGFIFRKFFPTTNIRGFFSWHRGIFHTLLRESRHYFHGIINNFNQKFTNAPVGSFRLIDGGAVAHWKKGVSEWQVFPKM